jgi:HlyD family secretion protein
LLNQRPFINSIKKRRQIMKKTLLLLLIGVIIVAGTAAIIQVSRQGRAAATDIYQTHAVAYGNLIETVGSTGQVRSNQTAMIAWQTTGRVDAVLVSLGEEVEAGQRLATLAEDSLRKM